MADEKATALIEHLSSEITAQVQGMVMWRSRLGFTAYFGPWIALGGYLALSGQELKAPGNWVIFLLGLLVLCLMYVAAGVVSGWIETHVWNQCNDWREAITLIYQGKDPGSITFKHHIIRGHVFAYVLMIIVFLASGLALSQVTHKKSPPASSTAAQASDTSTEKAAAEKAADEKAAAERAAAEKAAEEPR